MQWCAEVEDFQENVVWHSLHGLALPCMMCKIVVPGCSQLGCLNTGRPTKANSSRSKVIDHLV